MLSVGMACKTSLQGCNDENGPIEDLSANLERNAAAGTVANVHPFVKN